MASPLVYIIDALSFDMYVNCLTLSDQITKIHPWLTVCMEPVSRRVLASCFSVQHPSLENTKALLYEAFFATDESKQSASLPDEIWFNDNMLFSSLQNLTQASHLTLHLPSPAKKGVTERFFIHVLNACARVPTDEKEDHVNAEGTLPELEEHFMQLLFHYHHSIQPSTNLTPLESWQKQCHPYAVDPQMLYLLLHDDASNRY